MLYVSLYIYAINLYKHRLNFFENWVSKKNSILHSRLISNEGITFIYNSLQLIKHQAFKTASFLVLRFLLNERSCNRMSLNVRNTYYACIKRLSAERARLIKTITRDATRTYKSTLLPFLASRLAGPFRGASFRKIRKFRAAKRSCCSYNCDAVYIMCAICLNARVHSVYKYT